MGHAYGACICRAYIQCTGHTLFCMQLPMPFNTCHKSRHPQSALPRVPLTPCTCTMQLTQRMSKPSIPDLGELEDIPSPLFADYDHHAVALVFPQQHTAAATATVKVVDGPGAAQGVHAAHSALHSCTSSDDALFVEPLPAEGKCAGLYDSPAKDPLPRINSGSATTDHSTHSGAQPPRSGSLPANFHPPYASAAASSAGYRLRSHQSSFQPDAYSSRSCHGKPCLYVW